MNNLFKRLSILSVLLIVTLVWGCCDDGINPDDGGNEANVMNKKIFHSSVNFST